MNNRSKLRHFTLYPLSKLYGFGVGVRNKLYDWGIIKSNKFDIPIITVGNLAVGGTGKTPHTEYIASLLLEQYNVGILSRGYKRKTKGFVLATPHSTPRDIGDEPYQMYHKLGRKITLAVCANRTLGIEQMCKVNPELDVIVLDDGFQHRRVEPDVAILLTEYNKPYFRDELMPYGKLREPATGVERADMVIVTKCPDDIKAIDFRIVKKRLNLIPDQNLFFSRYMYEPPVPVFNGSVKKDAIPNLDYLTQTDNILAICGIANPRPFLFYVKSFAARVKVNVFADHREFTRKDMDLIKSRFNSLPKGKRYIVTTEKDAVRIINNPYFPHELKPYIYFIPIRVILDNNDKQSLLKAIMRLIKPKLKT